MQQRRRPDDSDRHGFDESRDYLGEFLGALVPVRLARAGVTLSVSLPRREFALDEPVPFTVEIRNRLPVPVTVPTPQPRLWGWAVDDQVEATDEPTFASDRPGGLELGGREAKRISRTWDGRFERSDGGPDGRSEWVLPERGRHELSAFVATDPPCASDSVTFELR